MLIKNLNDCEEITTGDNSKLRELFNPQKDDLAINYSLAQARVSEGETTKAHRLKSSEVYYILKGEGEMFINTERKPVFAGQAVYIPPASIQKIANTGDGELVFLCIVDPA